jgi:hypothetical protein
MTRCAQFPPSGRNYKSWNTAAESAPGRGGMELFAVAQTDWPKGITANVESGLLQPQDGDPKIGGAKIGVIAQGRHGIE